MRASPPSERPPVAAEPAPAGGRTALGVLAALVILAFGGACLRGLTSGPDAAGLPPLFGAPAAAHGTRLWLWLVAAFLLLIGGCPRFPARDTIWWRDSVPWLVSAALLLPGQPLTWILPIAPEVLLGALLVFTWWWRRRFPGWRAARESIATALPERRVRLVVLTLGAVLLVYLFVVQFQEMERVATRRTDFGTFLGAAETLAEGGDPYRDMRGYLYPPTFAFALRVLSGLKPVDASLLWFVVKLTLVVWTFYLADALLLGGELTGRRRGWFLAGLVLIAGRFWVTDLRFGNTNDAILFLGTGALVWSARQPVRAGVCLALAATIKVVPLLLAVYLLLTRRWRTLIVTAVVLVVINLAPVALAPASMVPAWRSYAAVQGVQSVTERRDQPDNQSLWGTLARISSAPVARLRPVWAGSSILLILYGAWATWRARKHGPLATGVAASLWPLAALIVSPGSWLVHYVAVLLPMAAWLRLLLAAPARSPVGWALFALANLVLTGSGWLRWSVHFAADHSLFLILAVGLYIGAGWQAATVQHGTNS